jgi:N-acetylglutamate synthase-like GNAT family acetyltransferase
MFVIYICKKLVLMTWQKGSLFITTEKDKMDIEYIHHFLATDSYWAENIPIEIVKKSIDGSLCFGVFEDEKQIGFARVVTDNATFGYLADVFIDEMYRGCGLSKWLMETIMSHPELQGFRTWMLGTKDAQGLYAQFGFKQLDEPDRIMRKSNAHVYTKKTD